MADNHNKEEGKTRKEEIHQKPDQVEEDEKQQPVTPEPPQRKYPQAKPERDEEDRKS